MPEKKPSVKTAYHVLKLVRPAVTSSSSATPGTKSAAYDLVAENLPAHGAAHAISVYAEREKARFDDHVAILVAVPSRSWKPQQVRVETDVRVRVGEPAKK